MKSINEKIEKNMKITEDTTLHGMIVGEVVVARRITLFVSGMIIGNLDIETDAIVEIHGTVTGDVKNSGGDLKVYGVINGNLIRQSGTTFVDEKAIVK